MVLPLTEKTQTQVRSIAPPPLRTNDELDVRDILKFVRSNLKKIIFWTLLFDLFIVVVCKILPTFYSYVALIEAPRISSSSNNGTGSSSLNLIPGLSSELGDTIALEVKSYVQFKFIDKYRSMFDGSSFIKKIDKAETDQYLLIYSYGSGLEEAKSNLENVIEDVRLTYQYKIDITRNQIGDQINLLNAQVATLKAGLENVKKATSQVGMSPILITQDNDLKQEVVKLESTIIDLKSKISKTNLTNLRILELRPETPNPVQPKLLLILIISTLFFSFSYAMFLMLLKT